MDPALDELLKSQPALWRGSDRYNDTAAIPTGFPALDAALPSRGWGIGGVTEIMAERPGIGEISLLLHALKRVTCDDGQWAAFINPPYLPYAPALANAGVRLDRLLIIDGKNDTDALWAGEQILRTSLFTAVIIWVHKSNAQKQRRLQLAAETGRTWATVYRPAHAADEHSPVSLRMRLSHNNKGLKLELIKVRGGSATTVSIMPEAFDSAQGAEWPGIPAQE
jgi:cell division inhibitor SulA/protein ImuA